MSTGPVDERWQEERRRDINYTHAVLKVSEHLPESERRALLKDLVRDGLVTTGLNVRSRR